MHREDIPRHQPFLLFYHQAERSPRVIYLVPYFFQQMIRIYGRKPALLTELDNPPLFFYSKDRQYTKV